jgi:hypothetical protein
MAGRGTMLAHSAEDAMMRLMRVSLARRACVSAYVRSRRRRRADDIGKSRTLVAIDRLTRGRTETAEHPVDRKQIGECDWQDRTQAQSCFCHGPEHANSSESKIRKAPKSTYIRSAYPIGADRCAKSAESVPATEWLSKRGATLAPLLPNDVAFLHCQITMFIHAAAHQSD